MEPVSDKWRAFDWNVIEADGHDLHAMHAAYQAAIGCETMPSVIVAETVKGKGVSFMEDQAAWHGTAPDTSQLEQALAEIRTGVS